MSGEEKTTFNNKILMWCSGPWLVHSTPIHSMASMFLLWLQRAAGVELEG